MKKLTILVLLAAFTAACTQNSIEEQEYENGIQIIDKKEVNSPRDEKSDKKKDD